SQCAIIRIAFSSELTARIRRMCIIVLICVFLLLISLFNHLPILLVALSRVEGAKTDTALLFFQAEDGIRDWSVTGVQTCALPICRQRDQVPEVRDCVVRLALRTQPVAERARVERDVVRVERAQRCGGTEGAQAVARSQRSEERRVGREGGAGGWARPRRGTRMEED